jgi:transposase
MKWVAVLLAAVLLLLAAWFIVRSGRPSVPAPDVGGLELPKDLSDRASLVRSTEQLRTFEPTPDTVLFGVRFLDAILVHLSDAEWPQAAPAVFIGWQRIHKTRGSNPHLQVFAGELLEKFVPHLATNDLESMIRSVQANDYYTPKINAALDRLAGKTVPAKGFPGSRLADLVTASVRAKDYERARRYLVGARFEEGTASELRVPVTRLLGILDLHLRAKAGGPETAWGAEEWVKGVEEWSKSPEDPTGSPLLLEMGAALARSCKLKGEFAPLKDAMAATTKLPAAKKYWADAITAFLASLPKTGQYTDSDVLDRLVGFYTAEFGKGEFALQFWTQLADENKDKDLAQSMWRVECLKRACQAVGDDPARLKLIRRIVQEYLEFHDAVRARGALQELSALLKSAKSKDSLSPLLEELAKLEEAEKVQAVKLQHEADQGVIRQRLQFMKRHLDQVRAGKGDPLAIRNMETDIKELERKLSE